MKSRRVNIPDEQVLSVDLMEYSRLYLEVMAGTEVGFMHAPNEDEWRVTVHRGDHVWTHVSDSFKEAADEFEDALQDPREWRYEKDQHTHD